jgi:hypothetical protein
MLKTTHFSLASGMHGEDLWFMLIYAFGALLDPRRADLIAALGETT